MAVETLISPVVREEIMRRLVAAEGEHTVRVIYACESGSRAWGFPSPDSDYDVRFIYVRPHDWYLTFDVETRRDVIEYPIVDEIDCGGWDLRKAMHLLTRTNGALIEWLQSPIRYIDRGHYAMRLRELAMQLADPVALQYHYSRMARNNAGEVLGKASVRLKKYFYVLRPLLAVRHVEQGLGVPPMAFSALLGAVGPEAIHAPVAELLERKQRTSELGEGPAVEALNSFIKQEFERHGDAFKGAGRPALEARHAGRTALNALFRDAVGAVDGTEESASD